MNKLFRWFAVVVFASGTLLFTAERWLVTASQTVDFRRDIEPIFAAHCVTCHGAKKAAGQLRLDNRVGAFKGGLSGAVILPGNSQASILLARLTGSDGQARMPMGDEALKPEQIELIRKWIDEGAKWEEKPGGESRESAETLSIHWAYRKPMRPPAPNVKNSAWVRNPIDNFILARLEKEGLQPSPEASKETLLRRVYLDLIGLPPGVKEVDEFLADNSPDAYEKVVDRLLASSHYGERWARPWLDLARYADSNGYEKDNLRVIWKYRDWVINALNQDLPFDQFTIEQLAGDMLPNATKEQLIATGFHRNTLINQEGGIDPEEARFEILVDRVNTTATVWLGSTIGCAQCHNHKYDPFSQKDYYKLYAFFNSAQYEYGYQGGGEETRWVKEPILDLPTPEQEAKRTVIEAEIKQIETKLKTQTPDLDAAQAVWEKEMLAEDKNWTALEPSEVKSVNGATFTKQADNSVLVSGANPEAETYIITAQTNLKNITALRLEAMTDASLPKGGPGRDPYGNFLLTGIEVEASPANGKARTIAFKTANVDNQTGRIEPQKFFTEEGDTLPIDKPSGWQINATSDTARANRNAVFTAAKPFGFIGGTTLTIKLKHLAGAVGQGIGRFRLSVINSKDPNQITKITKVPAALKPVLAIPVNQRTEKQKKDLATLHRSLTPLLKADRDRLAALQKSLKDLGIATTLVMGEKPGYERPSAPFRNRGAFLSPGEKVYADVPSFLPRMPESLPYNRLGLAKWLVSEENPLTARVTVNRFWEQFFGRGLVLTSEDFGTQGEAPSHPELLDWLAAEFMRSGVGSQKSEEKQNSFTAKLPNSDSRIPTPWSMKALHRLIVTSATYRQASTATPTLLEKDPYNRLLARGPRFRLEAEMIRDMGLAASGLLSRKVGGPSVFPLQPDGIWKSPYSSEKWTTSKGEDRYRRSLYTFIRRTSPFPQMMTFDGTSRETCTVRRVRTNTPLQALTLLNDEAAMENARGLALRMLKEGGARLPERLTYGFRLCLTRKPEAAELERLLALYKQQLQNFTAQATLADKIWKEPKAANKAEKAALTMVANVLLNLDETVTKE